MGGRKKGKNWKRGEERRDGKSLYGKKGKGENKMWKQKMKKKEKERRIGGKRKTENGEGDT